MHVKTYFRAVKTFRTSFLVPAVIKVGVSSRFRTSFHNLGTELTEFECKILLISKIYIKYFKFYHDLVAIIAAQVHSTKLGPRIWTRSNPVCGVSEVL